MSLDPRNVISDDFIGEDEIEGTAIIISSFYDLLASGRMELGKLDVSARNLVRKSLLVDSAVMMHGYSRLISDYIADISRVGHSRAQSEWRERFLRMNAIYMYSGSQWTGDLFDKHNPLWQAVGILKPNARATGYSQVNNGATRTTAARILRAILTSQNQETDGARIIQIANA